MAWPASAVARERQPHLRQLAGQGILVQVWVDEFQLQRAGFMARGTSRRARPWESSWGGEMTLGAPASAARLLLLFPSSPCLLVVLTAGGAFLLVYLRGVLRPLGYVL